MKVSASRPKTSSTSSPVFTGPEMPSISRGPGSVCISSSGTWTFLGGRSASKAALARGLVSISPYPKPASMATHRGPWWVRQDRADQGDSQVKSPKNQQDPDNRGEKRHQLPEVLPLSYTGCPAGKLDAQ